MADRYAKQPFLRILEFYLLHAIGELAPSERTAMEKMAPQLSATFKQPGSWTEIVERVMKFDAKFAAEIRQSWRDNLERAKKSGATLTPREFVTAVADKMAGA